MDFSQEYIETIEVSPYSAQLLVFKKKPVPPAPAAEVKPQEAVPVIETKNAETK